MRRFNVFGFTHPGAVRTLNEDHILMGKFIKNAGGMGMTFLDTDEILTNQGMIFSVADGIGGENAGDTASKIALIALERQFYGVEKRDWTAEQFSRLIEAAGKRANDTVLSQAQSQPHLSGMGCTLTGVCFIPGAFLVFNAGDSRVYRCRNGVLKPLTNDDTITNHAVQAGYMSFEEAEASERRHTLTNSVGSRSFVLNVDEGPPLRDDDLIIVASDGLHDMVSYDQLGELLSEPNTVEAVTLNLIGMAIENGGKDNVSVIVIQVQAFEEEDWQFTRNDSEATHEKK